MALDVLHPCNCSFERKTGLEECSATMDSSASAVVHACINVCMCADQQEPTAVMCDTDELQTQAHRGEPGSTSGVDANALRDDNSTDEDTSLRANADAPKVAKPGGRSNEAASTSNNSPAVDLATHHADESRAEAQSGTGAADRAAANTRHASDSDRDAPVKAAQTGLPQHKGSSANSKPQFSVSAFASSEAGRVVDHHGEPSRAGQVAAAGPVKRLLASHALSLASSLTSESSLLDGQALDQLSTDESQDPAKAVNSVAEDSEAADTGAANIKAEARGGTREVPGRSGIQAQQGKSAKGPVQRVLASHALSLASSLMSETSISHDELLEDTTLPPADSNALLTGRTAQPSVQDQVADAEQHASGSDQVTAEAEANDTVTSGAKADSIDAYKANNASHTACQASQQSTSHADNVVHSSVSPCPTEPMGNADTSDDLQSESKQDIVEQLDVKKKSYHLIAAIVHHGSSSGNGHYTVFRSVRLSQKCQGAGPSMSAQNIWFSISDENVCEVDVSDVLACEATLLLYEQ